MDERDEVHIMYRIIYMTLPDEAFSSRNIDILCLNNGLLSASQDAIDSGYVYIVRAAPVGCFILRAPPNRRYPSLIAIVFPPDFVLCRIACLFACWAHLVNSLLHGLSFCWLLEIKFVTQSRVP